MFSNIFFIDMNIIIITFWSTERNATEQKKLDVRKHKSKEAS